jgi:hypothetical protein
MSLSASTGLRNAADSILPNSVSSGETSGVAVHLPHSKVRRSSLESRESVSCLSVFVTAAAGPGFCVDSS